jgi:hypothetical protein
VRQPNKITTISFLGLDINPDITFSSSSNHQLHHFLRGLFFTGRLSSNGDHLLPPADYPPEITGYAEPWIVSPGSTVAIKV